MIRVGIIGAGFMGKMHSEVYKLLPDVKVVAVSDLFEDKAREIAEPHGGEIYSSGENLIQRSIR